ncbi:FAD-binding protein [Neomegalonema perideroedes]|uniref:FAD-binding protein n=1 Tax=Neomegalonema perideroedes TaxID=217219 RepID=UPI00038160F1|nr:FAD-binding protein [Neomegalonema perideroedes]
MTPVYREAEAALAARIAEAAASNRKFEIRGGGAHRIWGRSVEGEPLETAALSGISLYEPGEMTLVAGAGTPLREVEAALAARGQRLGFEPPDWRALLGTQGEPTLGGIFICGIAGPRRLRAGSARDHALGLRFVDGQGRVHRAGGRVMKNVTGLDMTRLLCGSHGTLGLVTEVALKTAPIPEAMAGLVLRGLSDAAAEAAMAAALGSPYEVSGAAHLPQSRETHLRIEGFAKLLPERAADLVRLLKPHGAAEILSCAEAGAVWREIAEVRPFVGKPGAVWRISLKPAHGPILAEEARALGGEVFYDWGGGLLWALIPEGEFEDDEAGASVLRGALARLGGGHATLLRGSEALRRRVPPFQPLAPGLEALTQRLRRAFDPQGIFNPGRMGA